MDSPKVAQQIFTADIKLVIATATVVASVLGSFFTLKNEVSLFSQKQDDMLAIVTKEQKVIDGILASDSVRDSRLAVLEFKVK